MVCVLLELMVIFLSEKGYWITGIKFVCVEFLAFIFSLTFAGLWWQALLPFYQSFTCGFLLSFFLVFKEICWSQKWCWFFCFFFSIFMFLTSLVCLSFLLLALGLFCSSFFLLRQVLWLLFLPDKHTQWSTFPSWCCVSSILRIWMCCILIFIHFNIFTFYKLCYMAHGIVFMVLFSFQGSRDFPADLT